MKKLLSVLLAVCLCCGMLAGCGKKGKPDEVSQEVYDLGVETCDVLDDYIQGKMKQESCSEKLEALDDEAQALEEKLKEELGDEYSFQDESIVSYIGFAAFSVNPLYYEEGETYDAEDRLEDLKEKLNLE